jgi:hypothetical protein
MRAAAIVDLEEFKADRIEAMLLEQAETDAAYEVETMRGLIALYDKGEMSAVFVRDLCRGAR